MREIKFRMPIFSLENKFKLFHYWGFNENMDLIQPAGSISESNKDFRKIQEQYTGLKDKNGKEIYEGDIIKNITTKRNFDNRAGEYRYNVDKFETKHVVIYDKYWCQFKFTKHVERGELEVIGNIHQNPELIK